MIYFTCDKPNSRSTGRRYTATLKWSNAHMPAGSTVAKLETTDRIRCTSSLHVVGVCAHSWDQQGECPNCKQIDSAAVHRHRHLRDWVQCDRCLGWQHGCCVNFNLVTRTAVPYVCALCCVEAKERGVQVPRSRDDNRSRASTESQ